jgi:hypothetical protein
VYDAENGNSGSLCLKKLTLNSPNMVLTSIFWDGNLILLVDYLEKGAAITAKYCIPLFDKLK